MRTGALIVYTSADSVFQIAAHEEIVPIDELYRDCEIAYKLVGEGLGVGRVIARPFVGAPGRFTRTANRRDYALPPSGETLLDRVKAASLPVVAIGKIEDLFAGRGITDAFHTASDDEGMDRLEEQMAAVDRGFIFTNLVDFDSQYGHRNDVEGYARNLERFDARLAARRGSARRHRRSRQRSDDGEHRSRARVRAADDRRLPCARRRRPRHEDDVRRPRTDARRRVRRQPPRQRHELPEGDNELTNLRQQLEQRERECLAPQAARSAESRGRLRPEPEDDVRPAFQRDRDRIIHCKAFRRLKHKTQVFFAPAGDHYRTRLTHTLEVSQIARTIAKVLRLHEELTEAIALGHDLGHTPFGHAGERVIDSLMPGGFNHYEQSLRIVDRLENNGEGLNLTWEVRDGIAKHSKGKSGAPVGVAPELRASTIEGQIMRVADLIAYVNHDIDDATRAGLLRPEDLPRDLVDALGASSSARIGTLVKDVVTETLARGLTEIRMSEATLRAVLGLRAFLFEAVYENATATAEFRKASGILTGLWEKVRESPKEFLEQRTVDEEGLDAATRDFIAGMTDRYAVSLFEQLFIPKPWTVD